MEDAKFIKLSLSTAISMIQEQHYTNPMIGEVIGVTPLQVHYYHRGKTKQPNPVVCMNLFENFKVEDKHILVDLYKDYADLKQHYNLFKERENGKV